MRFVDFSLLRMTLAGAIIVLSTSYPLTAADPAEAAKASAKLIRLSPTYEVWIDKENRRVVLGGAVCLREGQLEMLACLKKTKEHESLVAVNGRAFLAHAGLVAIGAEPGHPAQFRPQYKAADGAEIDITIYWNDEKGKRQQARAQEWLKNVKTGKEMTERWVFGGSGYWTDRDTGKRFYQAEEGDFVCVSNFVTAMLDLPIESSQQSGSLLFEANTTKIPPKGTRVSLVLTPRLKDVPAERGTDPQIDLLPLPPEPAEEKQ